MSSFSIHERRTDHLSFQLESFLLVVAIGLTYLRTFFARIYIRRFDLVSVKWNLVRKIRAYPTTATTTKK